MPLLKRVRVEVYLPDLPSSKYQNLWRSFEEEFTYAFGGSSIIRGLEGNYLSETGERIPDRINLLYSDAPLALSTNFESVAAYVGAVFQADVENAHLEAGVIRATHVEGNGLVKSGKGYGFVFVKREDGKWHCLEDDKTSACPVIPRNVRR